MTMFIISNEEMADIIKIIKSFEESGLLIKGISKTNQNESKEHTNGYIGMLLGALGASFLETITTGQDF